MKKFHVRKNCVLETPMLKWGKCVLKWGGGGRL
jgi:hypothetical protein